MGFDAVSAVNQVLVDELKAKSADGTLTKQEAAEAMRAAIEYFKTHISPQALTILQAAYGPIEEWLESFLEAKVAQAKWGKEAASITVPIITGQRAGDWAYGLTLHGPAAHLRVDLSEDTRVTSVSG